MMAGEVMGCQDGSGLGVMTKVERRRVLRSGGCSANHFGVCASVGEVAMVGLAQKSRSALFVYNDTDNHHVTHSIPNTT